MYGFGIDIGGSGIKGALVDLSQGCLVGERFRIPTPQPATPAAVLETVKTLLTHFQWTGPVGIGLPSAVPGGVAKTAAHIDDGWMGLPVEQHFSQMLGTPVTVLNDADAAGIAEVKFGCGRNVPGTVMMLTLGTGIGSALFVDGVLVPNLELGHMEVDGVEAEIRASSNTRKNEGLSWVEWAERLNLVLEAYQRLFWPDLFILGGGVSKKHEKFFPLLKVDTQLAVARLQNHAGIIGAAFSSQQRQLTHA
ncbi:MAG: ROK family protein [Myxococcota bacterium]|nr:ROK family protein [Myxococcota bacterium]